MIRSVEDMVWCRNAPEAPEGVSGGLLLGACEGPACQFPVRSEGVDTFFCSAPVEPEHWASGRQDSRYCPFHRDYLSGCKSLAEEAA